MNTRVRLSVDALAVETGTVKWFDATKGFGFVVVPGFDVDFLLHQHVLQSFGRSSVAEGSSIKFTYEHTSTGLKIIGVLAVDAPEEMDDDRFVEEPQCISEEIVPARVKWFDNSKGYGFVNCYGCSEDIFVGMGVLRRSALLGLATGEALSIQVAETDGRKSVYRVHDWT